MTRTWIRRLSLSILLLGLCGSVAWARPKVAVLGIEAVGSSVDQKQTDVAKDLTDQLRTRASVPTGNYQIAGNSKRELVDEKLMNGCTDEKPGCMSTIGANLGTELLLYGHIERTKRGGVEGYWITTKLLNVKDKTIVESWDEFVPLEKATGAGLAEVAKRGYIKLGGEKAEAAKLPDRPPVAKPAAAPGRLVIKSRVARGTVFIDDEDKGELENGTLTLSLREGRYKLAIQSQGYQRYEETGVLVRSGDTQTVSAMLEPIGRVDQPARAAKSALLVAAGGVVVAGVGGYLVYSGRKDIKEYDGKTAAYRDMAALASMKALSSSDCAVFGDDTRADDTLGASGAAAKYRTACGGYRKTVWGGVAIGVGAAATVGSLVYYMVKRSPAEKPSVAGRRVRKPELAITPIVSPDGGGATVRFDW